MRRYLPFLLLWTACACPPPALAEPALPATPIPLAWPWLSLLWPAPASPATPAAVAAGFDVSVTAFASRIAPVGEPVADLVTLVTATQGAAFPGGSLDLRSLRWQEGEAVQAFLHSSAKRPDHELQRRSQHRALVAANLSARLPLDERQPDLLAVAFADGVRFALATPSGDLCLLAPTVTAGRAALLAMPPLAGDEAATAPPANAPWLLLAIEVTANADVAAIEAAQNLARQQTPPPPAPTALAIQLQILREAIGTGRRRPALLAVAKQLQTAWLTELALAANDEELRRLSSAILSIPDLATLAAEQRNLACRRQCLQILQTLLRRDQASPALYARSLQLLGALALDPGALDLLLDEAADSASMDQGLLRENLRALGDRHASVRLRASDWLAARGTTVPGYDPLGDASSRAAALAQFQPTAPPTTPATSSPAGTEVVR